MAEPAKYLFDRSFARAPAATPEDLVESRLRAEFDRRLADARRAAFDEGRAEGERAALARAEAEAARTLAAVLERVEDMARRLGEECDAIHAHAVQVGLAVAERLAGEFVRREPLRELETLFGRCLGHILETPHVVVRVNEAFAETARERLEAVAAGKAYRGRLLVTGDAAVAPGDCRLEWAEGGITRDMRATLRGIEAAIRAHLAARGREATSDPDRLAPAETAPGADITSGDEP